MLAGSELSLSETEVCCISYFELIGVIGSLVVRHHSPDTRTSDASIFLTRTMVIIPQIGRCPSARNRQHIVTFSVEYAHVSDDTI